MGSGGVAIAALPTVICLKVPFSDGLGGGKMNHILRLCVKSFSHLGENEIKCWNEENSDIYEHEAIRFLVEKKDWAFVSDYVRLKVLYEHGGIYLDRKSVV